MGTGVIKILNQRSSLLAQRCQGELVIKRIADKDITSPREVEVDKKILTADVDEVINDPEIDVIVELIGGLHPAKEIVTSSLKKGKAVVTANKALLAECGPEIFEVARSCNSTILFEASVGGGIPIIKVLREGLIANKVRSIFGIINGTSNYILTKMAAEGWSFDDALREAQARGFAEGDPSLDVEGIDSSHKLAILASLAFGGRVGLADIYTEGITEISSDDLKYAEEFGYTMKLLAIAKEVGGQLEARVHPTLLPKDNLLSDVGGTYNAIYVEGDLIGEAIFYGEGAGMMPAASAIVADLVDLSMELTGKRKPKVFIYGKEKVRIRKMDEIKTRYYIRLQVIDQPGVLAQISGILGEDDISIASVIQKERKEAKVVPVVMMTHDARESSLRRAMARIDKLPAIKEKGVVIRMESKE